MSLIIGMVLLCQVKIYDLGTYGAFIQNVLTKILYIREDSLVLIEHDFTNLQNIRIIGDEKITALANKDDILGSYYNCKNKE